MLSLPKLLPLIKQNRSSPTTKKNAALPPGCPVMRTRRANYYLDASWHTRKSFRAIKEAANQESDKLGPKPDAESLSGQMDILLWSIRPELLGDAESKALYLSLLMRHLHALDPGTLDWMASALPEAKYECQVTENVIDDQLYLEHGFSNGPPHSIQRTLMTTSEFYDTVDQVRDSAQTCKSVPKLALPDTVMQATRDQLAINAVQWKAGDRSLACLDTLAGVLATTLGTPIGAPMLESTNALPEASTVAWRDGRLVINSATAAALRHPGSDELFARVQRDILECLLLNHFPNRSPDSDKALQTLQRSIWTLMEQIESLPCSIIVSVERRDQLRKSISAAERSGCIHVMPTVGAALGHAWIGPHLSITPDKLRTGEVVGTRYMHGGGQPQPKQSTINEWPVRWLTPKEMEEWHPSREAWHLDLPVDASELASAARSVEKDWKAAGRPYRFAEVTPDKPASGCRISVWESVRRAMSPAMRECFDEFNLGLPLPETPTALWERLRNFKRWVQSITKD